MCYNVHAFFGEEMERIDRFITNHSMYSRSIVKKLINAKRVYLNDKVVKKSDIKINEDLDIIKIDDEVIKAQRYVYLILNKPTGYVSATKDGKDKTVLDLVPEEYKWRNLFPAGRLDKNTTGMMLITDDRNFCT